MAHNSWLLNAGCLAIGLILAMGCDPSTGGTGLASLEGEVVIDGSSTVAPISMKAADQFSKIAPRVAVPVGISGTGGGFKRFTIGETDLSDASRPIKLAEFEKCQENSVQFIELPVAYDGLTIIVNNDCDWTDQITVEQLKMIFHADSAKNYWNEVDATWPAEDIKIFSPGTDSGTFDYFKEVVADEGSIRGDMSVSEDDNQIVQGVANNKTAIGFLGAAYYFENQDKLKALAVINPAGEAVLPTAETIENGNYAPFSRPLFVYVNAKSATRPEVRVFVNHYLANAAQMANDVGYVGLPPHVYERAAKNFRQRKTGTHYLTAAGEKRSGALTEIFTAENLN